HRLKQHTSRNDKLQEAITIMSELGYDTELRQLSENQAEIVAKNCVYQELAQQHHEFCQLDISFLQHLLQADIEHTECIVRGGKHCRFKITGTKES
ncbi:methanogen output domain 1-containing protein, partial [Nitrosomonas sp.]|uniref:methanogen output domain 1-containing protein n=1 Tax=Nitrosomonas sp. TaxID=42353 RepID=UPI0025EDECD9